MAEYCTTTVNPNKYLHFQQLIPGLPDDLTMECLLRVPITSHTTLRLVSHLWRSTLSHPSFFSHRRRSGFAENHVFLIQPPSPPPPPPPPTEEKDITEDSDIITDDVKETRVNGGPLVYNLNVFNTNHEEWSCLAGITIPTFAQCVVLPAIGKLIVLGGLDPVTLDPVTRVLVLDLAVGTWKQGSPMPTARSFFACAAVGSATVYVSGGHDGRKNALRSAEVYDAVADEWRTLPSMAEERDESYGLSINNDEKFWVISGYGTESQGRFRPDAEVYDPKMGYWVTISGVWPYPGNNPKSTAVVTIEGQRQWWHVIGGEIKEFNWADKIWKGLNLGQIPSRVTGLWSASSSVSLMDVGNGKILFMGNGGGEGMFILEKKSVDNNNNENNNNNKNDVNWKWQQIHAPPKFLGFPFSASHLLI